MDQREFSLGQRYALPAGPVYLTGIQALVRALLDQGRLDASHGLDTGGYVSGYRGSPLGGLDRELWREAGLLEEHGIVFQPGVNEDLAATAIWGTQQVGLYPKAHHDGVFSMWYGKAPGLDRSGDAVRHANMAGTSPRGGVLLAVGDDPGCKSSTLPSASEYMLRDFGIPVLAPSGVGDVVDLALAGWAMSRFSGCWVGMLALTDVMDSAARVCLPEQRTFHVPEELRERARQADPHIRLPDTPAEQEERLYRHKIPLARSFAVANGLNRVSGAASSARLVVVAGGKTGADVREALTLLGYPTDADLAHAGIRLVRLGMTWPLDPGFVRGIAAGAQRLLVVEQKRPFIETQMREHLFGGESIEVLGKRGSDGEPLVSDVGEIDLADIARAIASVIDTPRGRAFLDEIEARERAAAPGSEVARKARTPLYCAGCPHNTGTRVPEGSRAAAGIGCHYMAQWMDRATTAATHMGAEGINWVGQAPFTDEQHIFVNLGDGTYFHSGILAIRAAVAAGVNVTYKVLFNDAVAMTGGQPVDGGLTVADVVRQVTAEGVRSVRVVSDDPTRHVDQDYRVLPRERFDDIQRELRQTSGCTVLVYEQACATELRRRRKRGLAEDPDVRVVINDAVCEGCGDCSVKSNCVAVEPLETEFGTRRRINQDACNKDLSCVEGFCPSFVTLTGARPKSRETPLPDWRAVAGTLPTPEPGGAANILVTGVGGTGVVTLSQILGTAAHIDGRAATTLDMTGLAQKGGAVLGHVRIAAEGEAAASATRIPPAGATAVIACDPVTAASADVLPMFSPERTVTVANTHVIPTAEFVLRQTVGTDGAALIRCLTENSRTLYQVDADTTARELFGTAAGINLFLVGHAFQSGLVPLTAAAIERAITLNGVAVESNLAAFHFGRLAAHDVGALPTRARQPQSEAMYPPQASTLEERIALRERFLTDYQDAGLAARFSAAVQEVRKRAEVRGAGAAPLTAAVCDSYFALLAVKDEYEVARLFTDGAFRAKLERQFQPGYRMTFSMAPPGFARGRKVSLGPWLLPLLALMARLRRLRGSWLDPFRFSAERRLERRLRGLFEEDLARIARGLDDGSIHAGNLDDAVALASWPGSVRGYGHVKDASAEVALAQRAAAAAALDGKPEPVGRAA